MKLRFIFTAALLLAGCERPASKETAPAPSPTASPAAALESVPAAGEVGVPEPEGAPAEVQAPEQVNLDPQTLENQRVRAEVLKRIDLMPDLSADTKDKLYVQVDRARAMGKVITIPFPSGRTTLNASEAAAIGEKLELPQVRSLTDDPTVIFVVLGFADKKGDPRQNQEISLARANAVLKVLQNRFNLLNVMHAVGMGSSDLFDTEDFNKNRVVELWAVLP